MRVRWRVVLATLQSNRQEPREPFRKLVAPRSSKCRWTLLLFLLQYRINFMAFSWLALHLVSTLLFLSKVGVKMQ